MEDLPNFYIIIANLDECVELSRNKKTQSHKLENSRLDFITYHKGKGCSSCLQSLIL